VMAEVINIQENHTPERRYSTSDAEMTKAISWQGAVHGSMWICEKWTNDFKWSYRKQQMQKLRKGNLRWFRFLREKSDMDHSEITGGIKGCWL
jgi:hypothetical protein